MSAPSPLAVPANPPAASAPRRDPRDLWTAVALFVFVSSVYFATLSGLTSSNDGSHYALMRAIVDEGRFEIHSFDDYAEGNDVAWVSDRLYSDRPPGTALLAAPFYVLGRWLPAPPKLLPSRHDPENPALVYTLLLPVGAGTATVILAFLLLRTWKVPYPAALTAALVLAFGTLLWKYSTVLFSHGISATLVFAGLYVALRTSSVARLRPAIGFGLGLLLGTAVVVEYSNLIFAAAVALSLWLIPPASPAQWRQAAIGFASLLLGASLPGGFLAYYNTFNFGSPLTTSYAFAVNYPWAASLATTFDYPLLPGLRAMLWYGDDPLFLGNTNQGLFLLSPVLLFAVAGVPAFLRERPRAGLLVLGLFTGYLLLFARHHTLHGFTGDGRYFVPFIALASLPLAYHLRRAMAPPADSASQTLSAILFLGLAWLSVRNLAIHIGFSYNYHFDPARLAPLAASPANLAYLLTTLFPNAPNLPVLWVLEGLMLGALLAWQQGWVRWLRHRRLSPEREH